jgi:hypothetical protein
MMRFLVSGNGGPSSPAPEDMLDLLEFSVLPGFEALARLEAENKILGGGVPISERSVVFIVEAESNEALDQILRALPFWPILDWQVTPLVSFEGRAFHERKILQQLRKGQG